GSGSESQSLAQSRAKETVPSADPARSAPRPCNRRRERARLSRQQGSIMPKHRPKHRNDDSAESRRILKRMAGETEPGGASFVARAAKGAIDSVSAKNADRSDPIEYWG